MQRVVISVVMTVMFGCLSAAPVRAQGLTDADVTAAIKKGVNAIYTQIGAWGHWDVQNQGKPSGNTDHPQMQYGGWTAIALDALFSCGEEYQGNPRIQKALEFLAKTDPPGTYATGLRAHVWPQLPDQFLEFLKTDAYRLESALSDAGGYHYPLQKLGANDWDNSCTQYGALGGWECQKRGVPMSQSYWTRVEKHFLDAQNADGGWGYSGNSDTTQNMTAAGLACLSITEDYLHAGEFVRPGVAANHPVHKRIVMGVDWFDKNFKASTDSYGMVGVERVGLASGRKYFRNQDWYRAGATVLIRSQKGDGNMGSGHSSGVPNTAFSLIFLSRGRVPTFVNKLELPGSPWDNRPRDMANLAEWASNEFEVRMNWQVVGIERDPTDWMDAPILYLAGHQTLDIKEDQLAKIKKYLDMGGLLVLNADASSRQFIESATKIFETMYSYKFKPLGADDPLMNMVFPLRGADAMVMDNGVRHLIVMMTRDPAASWQTNNQRDISSWYLMGNIFQYAIEKTQPRNRLEIHTETQIESSSNTVYVGRAQYDGNWNPEPLAWEMLGIFDNNEHRANPKVITYDLKDIADADVSMIHVAGTDETKFTDDQVKAIQAYVGKGGVIFFEAAGGQPAFSESVRQMLAKAFPDNPLRRLSPVSPVITGADITGGTNNSRVDYRVFYKQRLGVSTQPALQAITFDDQPRVLFSAEDLSNAMLGQPVWGVFGYSTASARSLMTNAMLYGKKIHPADGKVPEKAEAAPAKSK